MEVRVEHSTLLHWKKLQLISLHWNIQTNYINNTQFIYHKHTRAFEMPWKAIHQSRAAQQAMPTHGLPMLKLVPEPINPAAVAKGWGWTNAGTSHSAGKGWQWLPAHRTLPILFARSPEMLDLPCIKHREIAVMHIQNNPKPNMTILDVHWLVNQTFFHLSSLPSVNWRVKLIPPLWNCNIQMRSVKAD